MFEVESQTIQIHVTSTLPLGLPADHDIDRCDAKLIHFGQFLFGSNSLSRNGKLACSSCHDIDQAFSGSAPIARGAGASRDVRHAPPLLNLYSGTAFMWDGRASSLQQQIIIPLEQKAEMGIDWSNAVKQLKSVPETKAFLAETDAESSRMVITAALAAYLGSLVSGNSAFDRYYYGSDDRAMSQDAKDGLKLFVRKAQCATCHLVTGQAAPFTDNNFHSIGIGFVGGKYKDVGRAKITSNPADLGLFKTPTLRNVSQRRFFMHDGSITTLRDVIEYYNRGGNQGAPNIDPRLRPLFLTRHEIDQMTSFLETLTAPIESYQPDISRCSKQQ